MAADQVEEVIARAAAAELERERLASITNRHLHRGILIVDYSEKALAIFTDDPATYELAAAGFRLFAINYLFSGISFTSSGFFTALSNGTISAVISFCRTLGFIVLSLLILPKFLGITGAWIAIPVAEFCTLLVTGVMHLVYFWKPGIRNYLR